MYPNPATSVINVEFSTVQNDNTVIKLMDVSGRAMMQNEITALNGFNKSVFDVSKLSKGVYMVVIENSKGVAKNRIVIN